MTAFPKMTLRVQVLFRWYLWGCDNFGGEGGVTSVLKIIFTITNDGRNGYSGSVIKMILVKTLWLGGGDSEDVVRLYWWQGGNTNFFSGCY